MIHQIGSDLDTFKTLDFKKGLNVLLSEKSDSSSTRLTRNGAGKSSLVELVHFLTGSQCGRESIFQSDKLKPHTFYATIDLEGKHIKVSRSGNKPNSFFLEGEIPNWMTKYTIQKKESQFECKIDNWKLILGKCWFALPANGSSKNTTTNYPAFRSLFPYFARRQSDGGFQNPIEFFAKQKQLISQVSISYLIGLDWNIPYQFQELKNQEKINRQLESATKTEVLGQYFGKTADIRTRLAIVEGRGKDLRERLDSFNIVPEYSKLEQEANHLTSDINSKNTENVFDNLMLNELKSSIVEKDEPDYEALEKTYREAGLVFPDLVLSRFEQVSQFHKAIIENRQTHLAVEIESTEHRIKGRTDEIKKLDKRRQQLMKILSEGGALEHYTNLQEEAGRLEAEAEELRLRLELFEKFNKTKLDLGIKRANLTKEFIADLHERSEILNNAIRIFEDLSKSLYERAGSLKIFESENGPIFKVEIESQRSKGISNMQIFCFDLMMMILNLEQNKCPDFLIHDSHLFDGVDERQTAKALEIADYNANRFGFQYIVTMNTDAIPHNCFSSEFDLSNHQLKQLLTDKTDTGGLFGTKF